MRRHLTFFCLVILLSCFPLHGCGSALSVDTDYTDYTGESESDESSDTAIQFESDNSEATTIFADGYSTVEILEYFSEVVFSSELDGYVGYVCKWVEPIFYRVHGIVTEEDLVLIDRLAEALTNEVTGFPGMYAFDDAAFSEMPDQPNMNIYFTDAGDMENYFEHFPEDSWGMATFWWYNDSNVIFEANVGIVNDVTTQSERNAVTLEEIIQALGIGQDSYMFPESLFYQDWSEPQWIPDIDMAIVKLLYHPSLTVGMTESDAMIKAEELLQQESIIMNQYSGKIMGVDFGDVRTGLAISDLSGFIANGAGCIKSTKLMLTAELVAEKAAELGAVKIIVGNPLNMDGSAGPRAQRARQFAEKLRELTGLEVELVDERLTTVSAHRILSESDVGGKKRKSVVDELSAQLILQSYLDRK